MEFRFSGADLHALVKEAGLQAILDNAESISKKYLLLAL